MTLKERTADRIVFEYEHTCPYFGTKTLRTSTYILVRHSTTVHLWERQA